MRPRLHDSAAALLLLASSPSCIGVDGYACVSNEQCQRADGLGRCEADGYCSLPDAACASGYRYHRHAGEDVAGTCTSSGSEAPIVGDRCGDRVVDEEETCDDGNRVVDDGCSSYCIDSGGVVWTTTHDGEAGGNDRAFGLALSPDQQSFAVVGITTVADGGADILVQLYDARTGKLRWTANRGGIGDATGQGETGEHVVFDGEGNLITTGAMRSERGDTDIWLGKWSPSGELLWETTFDLEGGDDKGHGVALGQEIVVVGHVEVTSGTQPQEDMFIGRFDGAGELLGEPIVTGGSRDDEALDVATDSRGRVYVTGFLRDDTNARGIWSAIYEDDDTLRWGEREALSDSGPVDRGVGLAITPARDAMLVVGVLGTDIWLGRYELQTGEVLETITHNGPRNGHDEAASVAFSADGSFVVVGFLDFLTDSYARADAWVRRYGADGRELWTATHDGTASEVDKALAVVSTDDGAVIVAGYQTVPGQSQDVWIRKYAL